MPRKKKQVEEVDIHERIVLTSELGAVIGKTPQWIRQLTKEGVFTQVERGKYVLGDSVKSYIEHMTSSSKEDNSRAKYSTEKAEHERLKKEKAELELQMLRGELHQAKEVKMLVSDLIITTKTKLQAIPSKLAPRLEQESAAVVEREIRREINAVLESLANFEPRQESG